MWYNVFGIINTILIFISVYGIFLQLKKIWQRKYDGEKQPTNILSLNQFTMSFFAYFSFFIYGYSISPFNHYIVWPRLIAALLVLMIIIEIHKERRSQQSLLTVALITIGLMMGVLGLFFINSFLITINNMSTILIVSITLLLAQGYAHQIKLILQSGETGAVDIRMSQFILLMDISTIAFALVIGVKNSWPLLLLASVSAMTKVIIIYLFRWVRISATAKNRRLAL